MSVSSLIDGGHVAVDDLTSLGVGAMSVLDVVKARRPFQYAEEDLPFAAEAPR